MNAVTASGTPPKGAATRGRGCWQQRTGVVVDVLRQCVPWQVDKRGKGRAEQKGESLKLES
jgi:hypothetical protein